MKILLVGATGTVGQAIAKDLKPDHEVIQVGNRGGDFQVDVTDDASVKALFKSVGTVDAIVSAIGNVHFGPLAEMTTEQFNKGLQHKLLGQVRLALIGQHHLSPNGSITLTSGIITDEPIKDGTNATAVNAGVEGFVRSAATELGSRRINAVSATVLTEAWEAYKTYFPGFESVPGSRVALAYRRSIEGVQTGRVYRIWG